MPAAVASPSLLLGGAAAAVTVKAVRGCACTAALSSLKQAGHRSYPDQYVWQGVQVCQLALPMAVPHPSHVTTDSNASAPHPACKVSLPSSPQCAVRTQEHRVHPRPAYRARWCGHVAGTSTLRGRRTAAARGHSRAGGRTDCSECPCTPPSRPESHTAYIAAAPPPHKALSPGAALGTLGCWAYDAAAAAHSASNVEPCIGRGHVQYLWACQRTGWVPLPCLSVSL
jgi:hypothetical protein